MSFCDFKEATMNRPFYKYVNVAKYNRKRGVNWLSVTQNGLDAATLYRFFTVGYGDNYVVAKAHVTWYVKFKGPQL